MSRQDDAAELAQCCTPLTTDPLTADQAEGLARRFKALGDPVRLRLLSLIASHEGDRRGTWIYYRVLPEALRALSEALLPTRVPA